MSASICIYFLINHVRDLESNKIFNKPNLIGNIDIKGIILHYYNEKFLFWKINQITKLQAILKFLSDGFNQSGLFPSIPNYVRKLEKDCLDRNIAWKNYEGKPVLKLMLRKHKYPF